MRHPPLHQPRTAALLALLVTLAVAADPVAAATRYVDLASPSPALPFLTWATAATNIQAAIDVAAMGDTILVAPGVYASGVRPGYTGTSNRVAIDKAVTVRSVSGPVGTWILGAPDPTRVYGTGSVRCVYLANGAVLDGFTLTNGFTRDPFGGDHAESARGGGAWCESAALVTNCVITGNHSARDGGGVYRGAWYRCVITGNATVDSGDGGGADHSTLYQCVISNNRARKGGGADNSTLHGCVVIGNNARVWAGGTARSTLFHCTVVDNHARFAGGIRYSTVYNSIVYHNRAVSAPNYNPYVPEDIRFSCTTPLPSAGNNIEADPRLASWTHLSLDSPCRGAGSPIYAANEIDLEGEPFANPPSMGADELTAGSAVGPLSVALETDFTNVAVGFTALFRLDVTGATTRTHWDFGDGIFVTNQLVVSHAWSSPGIYPVRLTAWNDATGAGGVTATTMVSVVETPGFYVDQANATPAYPYDSWATAATNIQAAIDVTNVAGRCVIVNDGVYDTGGVAVWGSMTNRVALVHGVKVRSLHGPQVTLLLGAPAPIGSSVGDGAIRCAYVGDGAALEGFTLTNGFTRAAGHTSREQGGGGAWCESRGVVTNCLFLGNTCARDGGGANGGNLYQCRFQGNRAGNDGGAVDDAVIQNCLLVENACGQFGSARGNAATESVLRHCTLVRNNGANTLGVVGDSRLQNCIVFYNSPREIYAFETDHSCVAVLPSPAGISSANITNAPAFLNLAAGDYRLAFGSPCIDTGTNLGSLVGTDLSGRARPLDGNGDGTAAFDMGAYEAPPPAFVWQGSPNPSFPYSTWATASHRIDIAENLFETVIVTNGVYTSAGPREEVLYIEHDGRVQSVNGPAVTAIDGLNQKRPPGSPRVV
jgi:PKD repeat protein